MATILTQQVNPWGALAANLAGNLIGDMLQRSREANQNRKLNALFAEAQNSLNAPQVQNFTAQSQIMPEGYDTDPWAAAMHKSYTPMTQYNIATADVNPLVQAAQQARPTVQDLRNAIAANLGTKRFSMLNPALVEQYMTPFYQSMEQQNQEAKKQAALDAIRNAQGDKDRLNEAQIGAAGGYVPDSVLRSIQGQYQYENPSAADLYRDRQFDATMNYNRSKDAQQQDNFMRTFEAQREDADRGYNLQERQIANQEEAARYARENPGYSSIIQGEDGGQWAVNSRGETKKISTGERDTSDKDIANINAQIKELTEQRDKFWQMKTNIRTKGITGENTGTSEYDDEIAKIENEIAELKNARKSIYESKRISTSDVNPAANAKANSHIGVDVLGGKGTLSSRFGMRGNKNHNGDDIAAPKDTPVTTPDV